MRQAQFATRRIPHTGLAAAIDVGHPYDIHPTDKLTVGERLAYLALNRTYGIDTQDDGPVLTAAYQIGETVTTEWSQNCVAEDGQPIAGFYLYRDTWQAVLGTVEGNTVTLPCDAKATAVSYAECGYQVVNLVNASGLPAWPGRVDAQRQ